MDINIKCENDDIIYGLSEISLYLSNIGEHEYAETIEEACREIMSLREVKLDGHSH